MVARRSLWRTGPMSAPSGWRRSSMGRQLSSRICTPPATGPTSSSRRQVRPPIFRREHGEQFLARRKNRPMFFIDIAVPRDVSQDMAKLDGIFAYDIDDLQQAVTSHVADRRKEAERAEAIIASEVERFEARLSTLDVVPTIVSLQDHLETIRQAEIDRVRGRMGQLTPEQEIAIEALTRGIINKVMHTPITTLKSAAKESEATTVVDVVRRLFNLQVKSTTPDSKNEVGTRH